MADTLRFDGQVAIVTGAGNGLGRAYALALAARGAKVVVNDLGGAADGQGRGSAAADKVVDEIKSAGGEAVANYDSVENGEAVVKTALDRWGKVHIIVNNAGILRDVSMGKMTQKDWDLVYTVHLKGTYSVTKAAWNVMREQRYGRIINVTSSAGLYGNFGQCNYSAMKLGIAGFSFAAAREGANRNIKVNVIAPIAASRMTATVLPPDLMEALKPEYVSPLVCYLAHENCEPSGAVYEVGAGWLARVRWQRAHGAVCESGLQSMSPEWIRDHISEAEDFDKNPQYPTNPNDTVVHVMSLSKL